MAVYKRGDTFWCDFSYAGRRYQESTKTSRRTLAVEYEKRRRRELEATYTSGRVADDPTKRLRTIAEMIRSYAEGYTVNHRPKSAAWVRERSAHIVRLLGSAILPDLTEARIVQYMKVRLAEGVGNRTVNMELECLSRAIGRTWHELWPKAKKLEESREAGKAISAEQETAILGAAAHNHSPLIGPFIRIALLTGMRAGEIRGLRWGQIDFEKRVVTVGDSKTQAGAGRQIPMNPDLEATLSTHASWFRQWFGELRPAWYLFPFSSRVRPVDPARPVTTIKTAWESVRAAAGVECRFHDLRHTVLTKLAERGVPESTMEALAGHMSRAMIERYSHIRMAAKRAAVEGLQFGKPGENQIETPTKVPTIGRGAKVN